MPKSAYTLSFNEFQPAKDLKSYTFYIHFKKDTIPDRDRMLHLVIELWKGKEKEEVDLSVPRAASFAFTIRVGTPSKQLKFPGFENSVEVIEELVENINLLNQGEITQFKERITDETYLKNFISLSKELAPDGEEVNLVGLTIIKNNENKKC